MIHTSKLSEAEVEIWDFWRQQDWRSQDNRSRRPLTGRRCSLTK